MTKIIVATGNENKMKEIRQIIKRDDIQFVSLKDEGLSDVEIVEDGDTFEDVLKNTGVSPDDLFKFNPDLYKMALATDMEIKYVDFQK